MKKIKKEISVLKKTPGGRFERITIENKVSAIQEQVQGYFDAVFLNESKTLVALVNENSDEGNRYPTLIAGAEGEELVDCPKDVYMQLFQNNSHSI